ncbi:signal transduction histidine kinase [Nocardioides luteus]|uniref:histidine kinase n=1 Tax=Nocardioides luteus TaxID=1844 RepID=A0ABQ5T1B1_9ACTN|nr:sensor histidine kinase [Nocardioides luteus]MDR7313514.1 signal transduction histidine kinase [Nocardioides luteus]GGR73329.1 two-component sensor histidine kinase [Nocardioides luteus]GLJ70055.1 two-component sensor histidine kinase [Nocardioides luteus]
MARRRITVVDWVIGAGVALAQLAAALGGDHPGPADEPVAYAALVASGLLLVVRRRAPVAVLLASGGCGLVFQGLGLDVAVIAFLVAVYAAVREGHRLVTVVAAVLMQSGLVLVAYASTGDLGAASEQARGALEIAWLIAAGAAGEALRQAEQRADEAERTREAAAQRRADDERLHIARELHDSLTHQISVIKVQSEAAVHVAQRRGDEVPESLLAIREAGREAARELRATLTALRDDDRDPPRGLEDVRDLVGSAGAAGLQVTLSVDGHAGAVPVAVGRTAYRIVQEALTNVTRHAAATTALVHIDHRPDSLAIRVEDDGTGASASTEPGVGLLGMHERVSALGGELRSRPRDEGGFLVEARLPVERTP